MFKNRRVMPAVFYLGVSLFLVACNGEFNTRNVDWPKYLGDSEMSHFSPLTQITRENVNQLEVAWEYHTYDTGNFQCNPIVVKGVMYGISGAGTAFAVDAKTGREIWRFASSDKKRFLTARGVAYWENGDDKRILFTYDEWLHALDATTGKLIPSFGQEGRISLRTGLGPNAVGKYLMSRTPGTVFEDIIVMPTVMMEGAGSAPGFIQAFSVITGELKWVFHTIPLPGEFGADTWPADVHSKGMVGGANNWAGMALDTKRGIIFAPTGSAGPDFFGGSRIGENLFANTLLALDVRTGERIWHYKIVSHDIWDMDLPAPSVLATIVRDGKPVDVVAQATKMGHVFVFNRETGEPIFPIEEFPVPPSPLKEEQAWPTQRFPTLPAPFTRQELTEADLNKLSPDYDSLVRVFRSMNKGRYQPFSDIPTLINPGLMGGAEWGGAAIDSDGIMYINGNEVPWVVRLKRNAPKSDLSPGELAYVNNCGTCHGAERRGNPGSGYPSLENLKDRLTEKDLNEIIAKGRGMMPGFPHVPEKDRQALVRYLLEIESAEDKQYKPRLHEFLDPWSIDYHIKFLDSENNPAIAPPWGTLTAIDLNTGEHKWQVVLGENMAYKEKHGIITGTENYGGPILTASGLLFIAATGDNKIRAFDKENGEILWEGELPFSGFATPSTYMVDGEQYVVIACGGTRLGLPKGDSIVAFKLARK